MIPEKEHPAAVNDGARHESNLELAHSVASATAGKASDARGFLRAFGGDVADRADEDFAIIPGVVAPGEGTFITGGPGVGKSTLVRQIGVQLTSDIHPFTLESIDGATPALLLHAEGSNEELAIELRRLGEVAGDRWHSEWLTIFARPTGMDLLDDDLVDELLAVVHDVLPWLICVSPLYRCVDADLKDEGVARETLKRLEMLASDEAALLIEAHTVKESGREVPITPYGSGYQQRWAHFGMHLEATGTLTEWRRPRVAGRGWPKALRRGEQWPWIVDVDSDAARDDALEAFIRGHINAGGKTGVNAIREAIRQAPNIRAQAIRVDAARKRVLGLI